MHFIALQVIPSTPLWPLIDFSKVKSEDKLRVIYNLAIYNWLRAGSVN